MALPFYNSTVSITRRAAGPQTRTTAYTGGGVIFPSDRGTLEAAPYGPSGAPQSINEMPVYTLLLDGEIAYTPRRDDRVSVTGANNQNGVYTIISEALEWQAFGLDSKQCLITLNTES